jgi:hypothetical protein
MIREHGRKAADAIDRFNADMLKDKLFEDKPKGSFFFPVGHVSTADVQGYKSYIKYPDPAPGKVYPAAKPPEPQHDHDCPCASCSNITGTGWAVPKAQPEPYNVALGTRIPPPPAAEDVTKAAGILAERAYKSMLQDYDFSHPIYMGHEWEGNACGVCGKKVMETPFGDPCAGKPQPPKAKLSVDTKADDMPPWLGADHRAALQICSAAGRANIYLIRSKLGWGYPKAKRVFEALRAEGLLKEWGV